MRQSHQVLVYTIKVIVVKLFPAFKIPMKIKQEATCSESSCRRRNVYEQTQNKKEKKGNTQNQSGT